MERMIDPTFSIQHYFSMEAGILRAQYLTIFFAPSVRTS